MNDVMKTVKSQEGSRPIRKGASNAAENEKKDKEADVLGSY